MAEMGLGEITQMNALGCNRGCQHSSDGKTFAEATHACAVLVVLVYCSLSPTHLNISWVSCGVLQLSLSGHGVMQIQLPSSAKRFLLIFINSISHILVIHSH